MVVKRMPSRLERAGPSREALYAHEAEQALLGTMLVYPGAAASLAQLAEADFHDERLRATFVVMRHLHACGEPIESTTVAEGLRKAGGDAAADAYPFVTVLAEGAGFERSVPTYVARIRQAATRRRLEALGLSLAGAAVDAADDEQLRARVGTLQQLLGELERPQGQADALPIQWADEVGEQLNAPRQIVESVLTEAGMSMFYGESNSGKSYLVLHLCVCLSRGVPWLGKRTAQGAVLYVAAEGAWSIDTRLAAYRRHYKAAPGRFGKVAQALGMLEPSDDVTRLIDAMKRHADDTGEAVRLLAVDTVARVMVGGDENAAVDMGRLVGAGDRIRAATGAHVLWVHHAGKDSSRGARGHSSLRAALDTEVEVTADADTGLHVAQVTKQRDLPSKGEKLAARFVPIELGRDQWEAPITACAVVDAELEPTSPTLRRMSSSQQAVLAYLAARDVGARKREIVDALGPQGIARPTVYRAINDLLVAGLVTDTMGLIYAPKP